MSDQMEKADEIASVMGQRVSAAIEQARASFNKNGIAEFHEISLATHLLMEAGLLACSGGASREEFLKLAGTWFDVAEAVTP